MLYSTPNTLTLNIINNQELEIIAQGDKFFIDLEAGLTVLGKTIEWWRTLTPDKIKRLKSKGFSGKIQTYSILSLDKKLKNRETISYRDWLALISYFASQRNTQAINLLTYFAQYGLQNQLDNIS